MKPALLCLSYRIEYPPLQPSDPIELEAQGTHVLYASVVSAGDGPEQVVANCIAAMPEYMQPSDDPETRKEVISVLAATVHEAEQIASKRGYTIIDRVLSTTDDTKQLRNGNG